MNLLGNLSRRFKGESLFDAQVRAFCTLVTDAETGPLEEVRQRLRAALDVTDGEITHKIDAALYDACHSLSQPSMQGKTWGEIRDYISVVIKQELHR